MVWRCVILPLAAGYLALLVPAAAQTRTVTGQAGILGEWDLSATVTQRPDGDGRRWSGPLSLKHIGFCSVDGPEEKTGELRLDMADASTTASVTLLVEGTLCAFKGKGSEAYEGVMRCPGRPDVPMMLTVQ